jgi:hypothetical protein
VTTIGETIGAAFQPVVIAVAISLVFALLRLVAPSMRWSRKLKHDAEILGALPDGEEKDLWAASVTAQGERLRIYREDLRLGDQVVAWYAFVALALALSVVISQTLLGWPLLQSLTLDVIPVAIPFALIVLINLSFAVKVSVGLVLGTSTAFRAGSGAHYPKYEVFRRQARKRSERRAVVERRLVVLQNQALIESKRRRGQAKRPARPSAK